MLERERDEDKDKGRGHKQPGFGAGHVQGVADAETLGNEKGGVVGIVVPEAAFPVLFGCGGLGGGESWPLTKISEGGQDQQEEGAGGEVSDFGGKGCRMAKNR